MKRALAYSVLGVVTVGILSYGAYLSYSSQQKEVPAATPTPFVVPSTWKHYTDTKNRIQFSYPQELHLSEAKDTVVIENTQSTGESKIDISIVDPIKNKKVFELFSFAINENRTTPFGTYKRNDDQYFGTAECFVYEKQESPTQEIVYACTHEDKTYLIDALISDTGITKKMFSDILLSLRFIPQQ